MHDDLVRREKSLSGFADHGTQRHGVTEERKIVLCL